MGFWNDKRHEAQNAAKKAIKKVVKPKKSRLQIEAELTAELNRLEENYRLFIKRQMMIVESATSSKTMRDRARQKIELACGSLALIKQARENLRDASSSAVLAGDMNDLGKALKLLNRLYGASPSVRNTFLNRQVRLMNEFSNEVAGESTTGSVLDSHTLENMGGEWQKNVERLISREIDLDEFIRISDDLDSPYQNLSTFQREEESEYEKVLQRAAAAGGVESKAVEASADHLRQYAEEIRTEGFSDYDQMMDDID